MTFLLHLTPTHFTPARFLSFLDFFSLYSLPFSLLPCSFRFTLPPSPLKSRTDYFYPESSGHNSSSVALVICSFDVIFYFNFIWFTVFFENGARTLSRYYLKFYTVTLMSHLDEPAVFFLNSMKNHRAAVPGVALWYARAAREEKRRLIEGIAPASRRLEPVPYLCKNNICLSNNYYIGLLKYPL